MFLRLEPLLAAQRASKKADADRQGSGCCVDEETGLQLDKAIYTTYIFESLMFNLSQYMSEITKNLFEVFGLISRQLIVRKSSNWHQMASEGLLRLSQTF